MTEMNIVEAIAVIFVVFSHFGSLPAWHDNKAYGWITERFVFWTGVDLFFCISGYVITRSLLPKLDGVTGKQFWAQVVAFWIRRWYRIIPLAWAWVGITCFYRFCSTKHTHLVTSNQMLFIQLQRC